MTLWELRLWQINKKEKEFSLNEIKELLISPKRARTYVPENMYDRFMTAYNKSVLCSTQKISFTYDKFIATAKKIIGEFPCTYEDCYNDETDMGRLLYTTISGGVTSNEELRFRWKLMAFCLLVWYIVIRATKEIFFDFSLSSAVPSGMHRAIQMSLIAIAIWLCKKEYFIKISKSSAKSEKLKMYGKYFLYYTMANISISLAFLLIDM